MSTKLSTFKFNVSTSAGTQFECVLPAINYMDAVSKFSGQGFVVAMNGRIILSSAINDFQVEKVDDTIETYMQFSNQNSELLKGLRLL